MSEKAEYARVVDVARTTLNTDTFFLSGVFLTEFKRSVKVAKDNFLLLNTMSAATAETVEALSRAACF